jgi:hypothetical protein
MRDEVSEPVNPPSDGDIFQLNLSYLLLAKRLLEADPKRAETLLGVTGPLGTWLRDASLLAMVTLASARVILFVPRLPAKPIAKLLEACAKGHWLAPFHVALAVLGVNRERPR